MNTSQKLAVTALLAALAPAAWGSTYFVTQAHLPPDRPLFGAVVRALPAGLLLLAAVRRLPRGNWWWRIGVLSVLNVAGFFPLIFLAAYHLSSGLAATLTATGPLVAMGLAWPLIRERPTPAAAIGALAGLAGVGILVRNSGLVVDAVGVLASLGAIVSSSLGVVLVKRWQPSMSMLTVVAWQLVAGGLMLVPFALVMEGGPPPIDTPALAGYAYVSLIGTALAFVVWFGGVRRLPVASLTLIGLLNPVVGTLLGVGLGGEPFDIARGLGITLVLSGVLLGQGLWHSRRRPVPSPAASRGLEGAVNRTDGPALLRSTPTPCCA